MAALAIDRLPTELWLQIISNLLQDESNDLLALYRLCLVRRCCTIARGFLDQRFASRYLYSIAVPKWSPLPTGPVDSFLSRAISTPVSQLEQYISSIENLPPKYQSSALFRTAPSRPCVFHFNNMPKAINRRMTRQYATMVREHTKSNKFSGTLVGTMMEENDALTIEDAALPLLLVLAKKCRHSVVRYNEKENLLVFWKQTYSPYGLQRKRLTRMQRPLQEIAVWLYEGSRKRKMQRWFAAMIVKLTVWSKFFGKVVWALMKKMFAGLIWYRDLAWTIFFISWAVWIVCHKGECFTNPFTQFRWSRDRRLEMGPMSCEVDEFNPTGKCFHSFDPLWLYSHGYSDED